MNQRTCALARPGTPKYLVVGCWALVAACSTPNTVAPTSTVQKNTQKHASETEPPKHDTQIHDTQVRVSKTEPTQHDVWQTNDRAAIEDAPANAVMPLTLLIENLRTTDYTALVRITAGKIPFPVDPKSGYDDYRYRAEVIETFRGRPIETLEYSVMTDRGLPLHLPTYPVVISLCRGPAPKRQLYIPDNGYISAASDGTIQRLRREKQSLSKRETPATVCQ